MPREVDHCTRRVDLFIIPNSVNLISQFSQYSNFIESRQIITSTSNESHNPQPICEYPLSVACNPLHHCNFKARIGRYIHASSVSLDSAPQRENSDQGLS